LPLEERFVSILMAHEYSRRAPIAIQSFEVANLKQLRKKLGRPPNVQLVQLVVAGGQLDSMHPADVAAAGGSLTYSEVPKTHSSRQTSVMARGPTPATRPAPSPR
jgi:glycerophosphoryl diester phosphodiesterase